MKHALQSRIELLKVGYLSTESIDWNFSREDFPNNASWDKWTELLETKKIARPIPVGHAPNKPTFFTLYELLRQALALPGPDLRLSLRQFINDNRSDLVEFYRHIRFNQVFSCLLGNDRKAHNEIQILTQRVRDGNFTEPLYWGAMNWAFPGMLNVPYTELTRRKLLVNCSTPDLQLLKDNPLNDFRHYFESSDAHTTFVAEFYKLRNGHGGTPFKALAFPVTLAVKKLMGKTTKEKQELIASPSLLQSYFEDPFYGQLASNLVARYFPCTFADLDEVLGQLLRHKEDSSDISSTLDYLKAQPQEVQSQGIQTKEEWLKSVLSKAIAINTPHHQ